VESRLQQIMSQAFHNLHEHRTEFETYREAAYRLSLKRIYEAMKLRGRL
jgi:glutamate dehydrogenase/leucine dehydrogenase